ncbi:phospholipase D-like domain-containing protein [Clostridium sp.]|uniref:phospholipase D-like domain-containing protein n=1 Tax=Clostridium sp. TaxID=1506 RepID=UPI0028518B68|nr:phospholipase D-like domain-containing protein [Clostridium sp.]MDR3595077.1 phospholipase D-like domain-containing protein [Clostridium sp.]
MNRKYIIYITTGLFIISSLLFVGCSSKVADAKTNTQTTQTASAQTQDNQIETYFTKKDGNLDKILIKEINTAQKTLDVAIYSLTKEDIANAIIDAKKKGIDVKIITDKQESQTKAQKAILDKFKANNIPVKINSHSGLMHLKLSVIDDKTALGGSYNYTANATKENDENLIVMRESNIVSEYASEFNTMWADTNNYSNY